MPSEPSWTFSSITPAMTGFHPAACRVAASSLLVGPPPSRSHASVIHNNLDTRLHYIFKAEVHLPALPVPRARRARAACHGTQEDYQKAGSGRGRRPPSPLSRATARTHSSRSAAAGRHASSASASASSARPARIVRVPRPVVLWSPGW